MVRPIPRTHPMTVQLKPVEPRRLYQHIADQIRELIRQGGFDVGTRLPPERDLAQQLGVSRPSLREALIALDIEGTVEIRGGSGVYVSSRPERVDKATAALGDSPMELMQARSALEGSAVVLACAHATKTGLAKLREIVDAMRREIANKRSPLEYDRQFHLAIAEMSGNLVMVRLIGEMFESRHSPISAKLSSRTESTRTWTLALREHEAILRAIESRDPLAAQTAIRAHLKASEERWVGG